MQGNDHYRKFAILMGMLGTAFGENGIPEAKIDIYYENLKDIPIDELGRAASFIIKNRKYSSIPTIAEIRETALGRDEDIETAALDAWGKAAYAVERGMYPTGNYSIDEAVRVAFGGWDRFGETDPENTMADRAHFLRVFKGLARSRRDKGELALPGHERKALAEAKGGDQS